MSEKLQDLRLAASALQERIWSLEQEERTKANRSLVGKCFAYRNSFSCPGPDDYWTLYQQVMRLTASGNVQVFSFQIDKDGRIEIQTREHSTTVLGKPISAAKFRAAWKVTLRHVNAFTPL